MNLENNLCSVSEKLDGESSVTPQYDKLERNDGPYGKLDYPLPDRMYQTLDRGGPQWQPTDAVYDTLEHPVTGKAEDVYGTLQENQFLKLKRHFHNDSEANTTLENVQTLYNTLEEPISLKPTEVSCKSLEKTTTTSTPTENIYHTINEYDKLPKKSRKLMWIIMAVLTTCLTFIMLTVSVAITAPLLLNKTSSRNLVPNLIKPLPSPPEPITSCRNISSSSPSGYYWVLSSNGSAIRVYCDMTRTCGPITGGWMRVTSLDMNTTSSQCPSSLCLDTNPIRTCKLCQNGACSSKVFSVDVPYSKVCGRIIAYQFGSPDGYSIYYTKGFDGISLTYSTLNFHIWTFFAALEETISTYEGLCSCVDPRVTRIRKAPAYFENHFFCDTAPRKVYPFMFHWEDPLWDGSGCEGVNQCCSFNNPPWFYRDLPEPTTEDIKMKVCLDEDKNNEDLAIEKIDIYVQ